MNTTVIERQCESCDATGLYRGMGERDFQGAKQLLEFVCKVGCETESALTEALREKEIAFEIAKEDRRKLEEAEAALAREKERADRIYDKYISECKHAAKVERLAKAKALEDAAKILNGRSWSNETPGSIYMILVEQARALRQEKP